ncbi:hypothetical protein BC833DRAFT_591217 [Globomyces pollinis-pini]|nr:hypothetical protein BC833DRAFT_591217 [Globomyces pollinis-pini]
MISINGLSNSIDAIEELEANDILPDLPLKVTLPIELPPIHPIVNTNDNHSIINTNEKQKNRQKMSFIRRASVVVKPKGSHRPSSTQNHGGLDEETIKIFFATHGLSSSDLDIGFDFISQDKSKITPADVRKFAKEYFPNLPPEALKVLEDWKETVTKDQMASLLLNKILLSSPYEDAFKWLNPDIDGRLHSTQLKTISSRLNKFKKARKFDVQYR